MNARVLIVDDEDDIRQIAQMSMEISGTWEVLTAGSGPEALQLAGQECSKCRYDAETCFVNSVSQTINF